LLRFRFWLIGSDVYEHDVRYFIQLVFFEYVFFLNYDFDDVFLCVAD